MNFLLAITLLFQTSLYQTIFPKLQDREKIDAINGLVFKNDTLKNDMALQLAEEALRRAISLDYNKGIIQAKANRAILMTNLKEDSLSLQAILTLDSLGDQNLLAPYQTAINESLAKLYFRFGLIEQANDYYDKVTTIYDNAQDSKRLILTYIDQGSKNASRGFYNDGLNYFLKAYETSLLAGNRTYLPDIYRYLANVYNRLNSFDKAKEFTWKSINHYSGKEENLGKLGDGYLTLAGIYVFENKNDSAAINYRKSLSLYRQADDDLGIAYAAANFSDVFLDLDQLDSCQYYLELASVSIKKSGVYQRMETYISFKLAELYCLYDNYPKAIKKARAALDLATSLNDLEFIKSSYETLSKINEKINRHDSALYFFKLYHNYSDSINNSDIEQKFASQRIKIETIEKENEILTLSKADIENKAIIKNKSFWVTVLTIGVCLLIAFISLSVIIFKQKIKAAKERASMEAILETQENERQRMAKDLHDSVGTMIAGIKINLQQEVMHGHADQENNQAMKLLDHTAQEIRRIAHNLMPGVLKKFGLHKALIQLVEQTNYLGKINGEIQLFGVNKKLNNRLEINLYRIVQELLQNIVKHAKATKYFIQITNHKNSLNLIVEDDGKGFNAEETAERSGMGLESIFSRVTYLNGHWQLDSNLGSGTSILIDIPTREKG